jgi:hypothetical protein
VSAPPLDPALLGVARASLALLFAAAAAHKLRDPRRFAARVAAYELLPGWAAAPLARALALAELALCVSLAWPGTARGAALGAAGLLVLYAGAIALNLRRGRRALDCGCGFAPRPLGRDLLLRNALLAAVALLAALPASPRALGALDACTIACATAVAAALFAAQDVAAAQRARWAA